MESNSNLGNYGYSTGGYTIGGLQNLANTSAELRDGWIEKEKVVEVEADEAVKRVDREPAHFVKYTEEFKAEIIRLKKEEKMPRKQIADKFGLTLKAVEHILYSKPVLLTGTKGMSLDDKQIAWLKKHYKHTKNDEIQVKLNITYSTLHRYARQLGLSKSKHFMKETQAKAVAKARESHEKNGTYPPKGYHIPRAEEFCFKPGKGKGVWEKVSKKRAKEMHANAHKKLMETYASEKRRVLYGLEQRTKLKVVVQSRQKVSLRHCLKKRHGYIQDADDSNVMYYDKNTRRSERVEQRAMTFGFEFRKKKS